jgi:hypothetical protein
VFADGVLGHSDVAAAVVRRLLASRHGLSAVEALHALLPALTLPLSSSQPWKWAQCKCYRYRYLVGGGEAMLLLLPILLVGEQGSTALTAQIFLFLSGTRD